MWLPLKTRYRTFPSFPKGLVFFFLKNPRSPSWKNPLLTWIPTASFSPVSGPPRNGIYVILFIRD